MNPYRLLSPGHLASAVFVWVAAGMVSWAQLTPAIESIATVIDARGWIRFHDDGSVRDGDPPPEARRLSASTLFADHGRAFGLGSDDSMAVVRVEADDAGYTHHRFQQYHQGIAIEGAVFVVHEDKGVATRANGRIVSHLEVVTDASITPQAALEAALEAFPAERYAWERPSQGIAVGEGIRTVDGFPEPTLVLTMRNPVLDVVRGNIVLAYRVDVMAAKPYDGYTIYIDAATGQEVRRVPLIQYCTATVGTATTLYDGVQDINTDFVSGSGYRLHDDCRGSGIKTYAYVSPTAVDVFHGTTSWGTTEEHITQAHWAGMMTYDYFLTVHNRNSYNGAGAEMKQVVGGVLIADYFGGVVRLAQPDVNWAPNWVTSLDVVGHEWTHGVVATTAGLTGPPGSEPDALDESFSDIFGALVECYADDHYGTASDCENFLFGEDYDPGLTSQFVRDMCTPSALGDFDTYGASGWETGDTYQRTGPQNRWFCLLVKGGSGTNDHDCKPYTYSVTAIGKEKAAHIVFKSLRFLLTPTSTYGDARLASMQATEEEYGLGTEYDAVVEAWNAVGVYDGHIPSDLLLCGTLPSASPTTYQALHTVRAGKDCIDGTTIEAGSDIVIEAGREVVLEGQRVEEDEVVFYRDVIIDVGSDFEARVMDCSTFYPKAAPATTGEGRQQQPAVRGPLSSMPTLYCRPLPIADAGTVYVGLRQASEVRLELVDMQGRVVRILQSDYLAQGNHAIAFDRSGMASGVYHGILRTRDCTITSTIVVE